MAPILDEKLIRKRAEHNDGILPDLVEIALHQEDLEELTPALEKCCRHIQILLMQGNAIGKIQYVSKLKELEYFNLSLNNVMKIEGLHGCEMLKKLDMTLNFVDLDVFEESIKSLKVKKNSY